MTGVVGTWRYVREGGTDLSGPLVVGLNTIADAAPAQHYFIQRDGSYGYATVSVIDRDITVAGGDVTASGATGVTVTGQQIAEAIYNLEIAVDVDGYEDAVAGTYTGTASALIIRPSDQLRHIGCVRRGWVLADRFDATTFNAARALEATNGMRFDFALTEAINSADLFEKIRHQSMSANVLTSESKYKRYVSPFAGTSLHTFTEAEDLVAPIRVRMTPLAEIFNVVGIRYCPDPWTGDTTAYTEDEDTDSQGTGNPATPGYGMVTRWLQDFDLIRDATAAAWARDAWLDWLKDQRYLIDLQSVPEWIHLEPWDRVAVTSTRMPGDWTAKEFLVQAARRELSRPAGSDEPNTADDRIVLTCREA
jgi:hypothetical protein